MQKTNSCPNCHEEILSDSTHCPHCGADLNSYSKASTMRWNQLSKNKKNALLLASIILAVLGVWLLTNCLPILANPTEYKAYQYGIEYVKKELKVPDDAKFSSFNDVTIEKSEYSTQIIIDSYSNASGGMERAWDISGNVTYENSFGAKVIRYFKVTVVLSKSGTFWCYKCESRLVV